MDKQEIIKNIAKRSGGDIYLGVVGAVRTGKSTFIKRMIETLVVPNIEDEYERKRALDEIPQSAAGKTIMTTEPKFVPNNAAKIKIDDFTCNIRLIDCVGYMVRGAIGQFEDDEPRMVTQWLHQRMTYYCPPYIEININILTFLCTNPFRHKKNPPFEGRFTPKGAGNPRLHSLKLPGRL